MSVKSDTPSLNYSVIKTAPLSSHILQIILMPNTPQQFYHVAGQYLCLLANDEEHPFSIANMPSNDGHIELHLHHHADNAYSQYLLKHLHPGYTVKIKGPYGQCVYDENIKSPLIIIAGGSGFANSKALLEKAIATKHAYPIFLYWGAKISANLYLHETVTQWAKENDFLHYIPVISQPENDPLWQGKTGLVHQVTLEDFSDFKNYHVYASGPYEMVMTIRQELKPHGLINLHSDALQ